MHRLYIKNKSCDANSLINARQFYNSLEDSLICKYSTTFKIAKLGQNRLCHSIGKKRKKIHVSSNREQIERILHTTRAALKETQLLSNNKTTNYF